MSIRPIEPIRARLWRSWDVLPPVRLQTTGEIASDFHARGLSTYQDAARFVHDLPYGRNADRSNWRLVLSEARGTCSTKHALLAALAREESIPAHLTVGLYEMDDHNTPGVGGVLARYGLEHMLEAHCYLRFEGLRVDVTRSRVTPAAPIGSFLMEETITPDQIGRYKVERHRRLLAQWSSKTGLCRRFTFEQLWQIREECIAALAQPSQLR